ncbi:MAG: hypothetical protein AB3N24_08335, partial [Leisingera sp.]
MSSEGKARIGPDGDNSGAAAEAVPVQGPGQGAEGGLRRPRKPARRRWHWRLLRGMVWMLALLCFLGAGGIYFGIGTRLDAPDWLRQRVEARIER